MGGINFEFDQETNTNLLGIYGISALSCVGHILLLSS